VLSILIWWAIPAAAVLLAAMVLVVSRQVRLRRADMSTLHRYQRARQVLAQSQMPSHPQSQVRLREPSGRPE
jgi:cytochrome c-type biogenesis protein CcmH/NrfF